MAEGFLRNLAGDRYDVYSAGTVATSVRPEAVTVMAELGIDIGQQTSKSLDRFRESPWDLVITVCDEANESCPVFPGATRRQHWSFIDPSRASGSPDERLNVFREVRDQIGRAVNDFVLAEGESARA